MSDVSDTITTTTTTTRNSRAKGSSAYVMWRLQQVISLFHVSLVLLLVAHDDTVSAFIPTTTTCRSNYRSIVYQRQCEWTVLPGARINNDIMLSMDAISRKKSSNDELPSQTTRRRLINTSIGSVISVAYALSSFDIEKSNALVKGNAPPSASNKAEKLKCTNVEECQEMAERREQQLREQQDKEAAESSTLIATTKRGTRYRDIVASSGAENSKGTSTLTVKDGDQVTMYYKVLKLGKRSYDGLSGEGTVVFSCGYGLEDDETSARTKSFTTNIGNLNNIVALNDGMIGMPINAIRRIQVLPDRGWRKPDAYCDGGPGGSGVGGNLKTDYVVVPTATMVATEACFDTTKLPFPTQSYAEQRRMAQRFDQSLILEVEVIDITRPS